MHVHELQHLAFGNHVGGVGQDLHDAHVAGVHHHLEGARIEEVADQHAGRVAKDLVGRGAAPAQGRFVDHVIVQQGGGMDEFDDGCDVVPARLGVTQRAAGQQKQGRAQALAAGRDDVTGDLGDQGHTGVQAPGYHGVDVTHVGGYQGQGGGGAGGVD